MSSRSRKVNLDQIDEYIHEQSVRADYCGDYRKDLGYGPWFDEVPEDMYFDGVDVDFRPLSRLPKDLVYKSG